MSCLFIIVSILACLLLPAFNLLPIISCSYFMTLKILLSFHVLPAACHPRTAVLSARARSPPAEWSFPVTCCSECSSSSLALRPPAFRRMLMLERTSFIQRQHSSGAHHGGLLLQALTRRGGHELHYPSREDGADVSEN